MMSSSNQQTAFFLDLQENYGVDHGSQDSAKKSLDPDNHVSHVVDAYRANNEAVPSTSRDDEQMLCSSQDSDEEALSSEDHFSPDDASSTEDEAGPSLSSGDDLSVADEAENVTLSSENVQPEDTEESNEGEENNLVYTMDLQGVLLCPYLKASALYYKMKLCVHKFTIFNKKTKDAYCYVWHEGEGGVTSNEFASLIVSFLLDQNVQQGQQIILWSAGCGYQNRNANLSNALLYLSHKLDVTIKQKYLTKGHTQMECDAMHSLIERKLKNKSIYTPAGYVEIMKSARSNPQPFHVKYVDHTFFKDYTTLKMMTSIRPGYKAGDPTVNNLKALKYCPDGQVFYKLEFEDDWQLLPKRQIKRSRAPIPNVPPLYQSSIKISADKYTHLQQLKSVMAKDFHPFYDLLHHH